MGDGDGASDDQGDVERVDDFAAFPSDFAAADEMIGNAVVAAKNRGSDEAQEFLGAGIEWAGLTPGGREQRSA